MYKATEQFGEVKDTDHLGWDTTVLSVSKERTAFIFWGQAVLLAVYGAPLSHQHCHFPYDLKHH
jgi:hypothetical protein